MVNSGEPGKLEQRMVMEYGITLNGVWLPLAMLGACGPMVPGMRRSPRPPPTRSGYSSCTPWPTGTTRLACTAARA